MTGGESSKFAKSPNTPTPGREYPFPWADLDPHLIQSTVVCGNPHTSFNVSWCLATTQQRYSHRDRRTIHKKTDAVTAVD